jgi:hypothetical protein
MELVIFGSLSSADPQNSPFSKSTSKVQLHLAASSRSLCLSNRRAHRECS